MPEQSPGTGDTRSDGERRGSETAPSAASRRNRNRRPNTPKFEGKWDRMKAHVYDVTHVANSYELFNTTTEAIGEYNA